MGCNSNHEDLVMSDCYSDSCELCLCCHQRGWLGLSHPMHAFLTAWTSAFLLACDVKDLILRAPCGPPVIDWIDIGIMRGWEELYWQLISLLTNSLHRNCLENKRLWISESWFHTRISQGHGHLWATTELYLNASFSIHCKEGQLSLDSFPLVSWVPVGYCFITLRTIIFLCCYSGVAGGWWLDHFGDTRLRAA